VGWGRNDYNQITTPSGNDFVAIAAGLFHGLALKQDGSLAGWGRNDYGQATPSGGNDFVGIAAGGYHSLALKENGLVAGWGRNDYGQATPPAEKGFVVVSAGEYHSPAILHVCEYSLAGDEDDDCRVDFYDFSKIADFDDFVEMAWHWLIDCDIEPENPACIPK
jgi:hypothetical protein